MLPFKVLKALRDKLLSPLSAYLQRLEDHQFVIERRLEYVQEALGRIEARQASDLNDLELFKNEYRVFSQWGEDGIIQFLLRQLDIREKIFVEFGVEDYTESNTRFLLVNNNWSGLVIDGDTENIRRIKTQRYYWLYNLKAVHCFVTRENINKILEENGLVGEIGLLSIDIDGNDYWIWEAVQNINPAIVIVEYNHRFGSNLSVTVPYDEAFDRTKAHYSMIYYGASLKAMCLLGKRKGYAFVGCNSNGVNAFFVRRDLKPDVMKELSAEEGYVAGQFCDARDQNANLTKLSRDEEQLLLTSLPLVEIE